IGSVASIDLDPSGRAVILHVRILGRYRVHGDALFTIQQQGFLGDQFVSVIPGRNALPPLKDGDEVACEEPFNLQEVARSTAGLLRRVDETARKLNEYVARIDQTLLSPQTLTNVSAAVRNFRLASEGALNTLHGVDELVQTNTPPLTVTVSNLVIFSEELN